MTVTVVGAALAAGLFCGGVIGSGTPSEIAPRSWRISDSAGQTELAPPRVCTKGELCTIVTATSPLCLCTAARKEHVQCKICFHTACTACGQHPQHEYHSVPAAFGEPRDVEEVRRLLPPCVEMSVAGVPVIYYQCSSGLGVASWHATWDTQPPTRELRCTVWTRPYPRVVWQVGDMRLEVVDGEQITTGVWTTLATPSYLKTGVVAVSDQAVIVGGWLHH